MIQSTAERILAYWFGNIEDELATAEQAKRWYAATHAQDLEIKARFETLVKQAAAGQLEDLQQSPRGSLALIILLDQMTRNIYRGTAKAFASDHLVINYCLEGIDKGYDQSLCLIEKCFYYHPLEHSESLDMQNLCLLKFNELEDEYFQEKHLQVIHNALDFAGEHADIIERFGRFPHRNQVLNRQSSSAEIAYLKSAKRFGQ
ncbi:DUF924 family protein [Thalassotalea litorea]|uniref:DUF924 family protein n=1 Tax=Thalassotalea litorea TaxID=2020715 RepID=UPI003735DCF0